MRLIVTLLFTALLVLGVWTFVDADTFLLGPMPEGYRWWWPGEVSTFGEDIDFLFFLIAAMVLVFFVLTEGLLIYFVFKYSAKRHDKATYSHGNHRLEMLWTAIPAGLLLIIAFSQMSTWAAIKFRGPSADETPFAEIFASQFDWRFRYPGEDGRFGTMDDIESAWELVVPEGERLLFQLRSRDVLHSFFVPKLRLKQDAVPGMTIPVWFEVDTDELAAEPSRSFDVICAELCGWGHYKMSGRIRVVTRDEFDAWMSERIEEKYTNGKEDES